MTANGCLSPLKAPENNNAKEPDVSSDIFLSIDTPSTGETSVLKK